MSSIAPDTRSPFHRKGLAQSQSGLVFTVEEIVKEFLKPRIWGIIICVFLVFGEIYNFNMARVPDWIFYSLCCFVPVFEFTIAREVIAGILKWKPYKRKQ